MMTANNEKGLKCTIKVDHIIILLQKSKCLLQNSKQTSNFATKQIYIINLPVGGNIQRSKISRDWAFPLFCALLPQLEKRQWLKLN